jgi:uncharacterized phage-associated protein
MYEARKIANLLISRFDVGAINLTNLRLNKLLYFIHGHSLLERKNGLVRNHFEAWPYGPVVRVVYDAFKKFGDKIISEPASFLDYATGEHRPIPFDEITPDDTKFIANVCRTYAEFSTARLVALSHQRGGAWDTIFAGHSKNEQLALRISDDLILRDFLNEPEGNVQH